MTETRPPLELFHATYSTRTLGQTLGLADVAEGELIYPAAVAAIEAARPADLPSRVKCWFATDRLDGATRFARSQRPDLPTQPNVYRVRMPQFHKAPMAIVRALSKRIDEGDAVEPLVEHYWAPDNGWRFYEYFGPEMTVIEQVEPASEMMQGMLVVAYGNDLTRAHNLR